MNQSTTNMGQLFDEHEADLMKAHKAITPEQLAEENRLRKIKSDYEALHTAIETDEDRADPDKYPPEDDEGEE
jgi:hypothetical protein